MKRIQIFAGFIAIVLTGCDRSTTTTRDTRIDGKLIPESFRGSWIEAHAAGNSQSKLEVGPQSITWTRDEVGAPVTTVSTNYTIHDVKHVSFPASIAGSRAVFNEPSIVGSKMEITPAGAATSEGQTTVTITVTEQGLVLSVPEVKIDKGAYVQTLPPKAHVYTRKLQGGQATK